MDVQAHSAPESRQAPRNYLRNRRLTTSIYQTLTAQTLNDLKEALRLLSGAQHPFEPWAVEVDHFLNRLIPNSAPRNATALPGLREGE